MRKAIVGLVAVGAVIGLRSMARRMGPKMREHCEQMAARFADHGEVRGREAMDPKMRDHCEQMAARFADHAEAVSRT